jgi:hypothetical protein
LRDSLCYNTIITDKEPRRTDASRTRKNYFPGLAKARKKINQKELRRKRLLRVL